MLRMFILFYFALSFALYIFIFEDLSEDVYKVYDEILTVNKSEVIHVKFNKGHKILRLRQKVVSGLPIKLVFVLVDHDLIVYAKVGSRLYSGVNLIRFYLNSGDVVGAVEGHYFGGMLRNKSRQNIYDLSRKRNVLNFGLVDLALHVDEDVVSYFRGDVVDNVYFEALRTNRRASNAVFIFSNVCSNYEFSKGVNYFVLNVGGDEYRYLISEEESILLKRMVSCV